MAIIRNIMDDIKRYIGSNEQTDDARKKKALQALSLLMCPPVMENSSMQAVVGFDERNAPRFWNMTEENLLATCKTGVSMNYLGCTTVLVSLLLRFAKEEFQYYLFTDEFAPNYLRENESCAGSAAVLLEEREVYRRFLEKLFNELNCRKTLSEVELKKQPFLLVVFGNACRFFADNEFESFRDLFSLLFRQGKSLRVACMMMTTRFESEFLYHRYKDTFSCFVVGSTCPETAKELLQKDIPDWHIDGYRTDTCFFQNKDNRVQIQTYHLPLGIGLR